MTGIKQINANKNVMVTAANVISALLFTIAEKMTWYQQLYLLRQQYWAGMPVAIIVGALMRCF